MNAERVARVYKRVLIKLSGEALGDHGILFDFKTFDRMAGIVRELTDRGTQVALVVGGGNIWRGRTAASMDMNDVTADHMGMLGTVINSLAMQDALVRAGAPARVMSAVEMTRFAEAYVPERAVRHLAKGRVVLCACGTANPFFSTDTAAVIRAVEMNMDAILMAKNAKGVFDDDPKENPDAKLLPDITYAEAQRRGLQVMDAAAFSLCMEKSVPAVHVFDLHPPENILRVMAGERLGSVVHP